MGVRLRGSFAGFAGLVLTSALMASCFGLLIAALGRPPQATRGLAILAVLVLVMLGGAWMPSFLFPAWLQRLVLANPARWAVDGFDGVFWGAPFAPSAGMASAMLLGFSALLGLLALRLFRWEGD